MKITIDLPPDLVRALKIRAVNEGRKLKDLAADLLHRGLAASGGSPTTKPLKVRIEKQSDGLPVVLCSANAPARRMSAAGLLALEQQTLNQEDLRRLGHPAKRGVRHARPRFRKLRKRRTENETFDSVTSKIQSSPTTKNITATRHPSL